MSEQDILIQKVVNGYVVKVINEYGELVYVFTTKEEMLKFIGGIE